jgi:small basic protein (TIGR04137 family)
MSLHRSLKTQPAALNQHRNVLTRTERIARLVDEGRFVLGQDAPTGLVKVGNRKIATAKKKKKDDETESETETTTEGAEGAA